MSAIKNQYEKFPYPKFPLFLKPRWQEGYTGSGAFSRMICSLSGSYKRVLVLGCGDTFPYILNKWESDNIQIDYVDFSKSNIRRAKTRTFFTLGKNINYFCISIEDFLERNRNENYYDHIDLYGVLHHTKNPFQIIEGCSKVLNSSGTMRVMIYNSISRKWIHFIQDLLKLMNFTPFESASIKKSKDLCFQLVQKSNFFKSYFEKLDGLNESQFVDMFMNQLEQRNSFIYWENLFSANGFKIRSLLDRYGELDYLKNPLWVPPNWDNLSKDAAYGLFNHNLELYLSKSQMEESINSQETVSLSEIHSLGFHVFKLRFSSPPKNFFDFPETAGLSLSVRYKIWQNFVEYLFFRILPDQNIYDSLDIAALQRLSRVGAISKKMILNSNLIHLMESPMEEKYKIRITKNIDEEVNLVKMLVEQFYEGSDRMEFKKRLDLLFQNMALINQSIDESKLVQKSSEPIENLI